MRILLAGATGALGATLTPMLVEAGHDVFGTSRSRSSQAALAKTGAEPVQMDGLDPESVRRAMTTAKPDVVIHQLTALKGLSNLKKFDEEFAETNRLRTEGTDHLLKAALEVGATRFIAQSFTGWTNPRGASGPATETDGLDPEPQPEARRTLAGIGYVERVVTETTGLTGIALRYGGFYGPGTGLGRGGDMLELVRGRKLPIVGAGQGVWSLIHIHDAARATALAVDHGATGVYNIVDDRPAPVAEWLPALAETVGAKGPRRVPAWLARPMIGRHGVMMMTAMRGSSNAKAKRELGWEPAYPTWREGFQHLG
jgi:nucleoside-diphosphate-sugar epimerase